MDGHYAIKSIVLIDFIDVKDIAIAGPFPDNVEVAVKSSLSSDLLAFAQDRKFGNVQRIAVQVGNPADPKGTSLVVRAQRGALAA